MQKYFHGKATEELPEEKHYQYVMQVRTRCRAFPPCFSLPQLILKVLFIAWGAFTLISCKAHADDYLLAPAIHLQPYEKWTGKIPDNLSTKNTDRVYLQFKARINAPSNITGSTPAFRVYVDRVPVEGERLANKKESYYINATSQRTWYSGDGMFDALYDDFSRTSPATWGRLHTFAFDITNLVKVGSPQTVAIEYLFNGVPGTVFDVENCQITVSAPIEKYPYPENSQPYYLSNGFAWARQLATAHHHGIDVTLNTTTDLQSPLTVNSPLQLTPFAATATSDAQMNLMVHFPGWDGIPIHTLIGTPKNGWKKANDFTPLNQSDGVWESVEYRLKRTVTPDAQGIIVEDHVTNLTQKDLPFAILYQMDVGDLSRLKEFRLNGKQQDMFYANSIPSRESASYPVGYVRDDKRAYAFVMEDDALRPNGSVMAWDSLLNFGTDMCYLEPGASHTFRFRVIGAPSLDYFEILNRLRNAWNNYQTIPGLFGFVYPQGIDAKLTSPQLVKNFFDSTGITVPALPDSLPVSSGKAMGQKRMVYGNEPTSMIEAALTNSSEGFAALMKEAGVKLPLLFYMDAHLVRTDEGLQVPTDLADGIVKDIGGRPVDYQPGWLHVVLPLADNSVGERIKENLQAYFAKPYIGGVFLDEWDHSRARYDFGRSDGITARLNADLSINSKIGFIPRMTEDFQKETVDYLQQKKAVVYVNQMDQTAAAQALPVVHFAEPTQYESYLLRSAQVAKTPLALNLKRSVNVWTDVYEYLKGGVLLCFYAKRLYGDHLLKYIYPIKVLSAEAGCVMGEDKIVTLRDGAYSFQDNAPMEALIFSAPDGTLQRRISNQKTETGKNVISLKLDAGKSQVS